MHEFKYVGGRLHCEGVALASLARRFGTPLYVYSQRTLADHFRKLDAVLAPLDHRICYAVKANSNQAVLRTLHDLGAGFDVVSAGELSRVQAAGGDPARCVFAGVGKSESEIELALRLGIYSFNVESEPELERIDRVARRLKCVAPVAARVNPNVDAHTHAKITTGTYENKFGIPLERIAPLYARAARLRHVRLRGLQMHLGSQLTEVKPFEQAVRKVLPLLAELRARHPLEFLSLGGGMGIVYRDALASGPARWWRQPDARAILTPQRFADVLLPLLKPLGLRVLIEPGRFIVGNAGALLTRVEFVKRTGLKNFVIVDAAMNDLIRPAFYDSYHEIVPLDRVRGGRLSSDVVGPICESGDYFCKDRLLPKVGEGDYLALLSAGAYGSVMSSNYNSRPLAAEVMVAGRRAVLVRRRQALDRIWADECLPPWIK
jgi:diaminopimelate decarboxylase